MKRNGFAKIAAVLALLGIVIGIVGTGLLVLFSGPSTSQNTPLTDEQIVELEKLIEESKSNSGDITSSSLSGALENESLIVDENLSNSGEIDSTGSLEIK